MATIRVSAVDRRDAQALLAEYFAARAAGFPGGGYRTAFPDPELFVPPAGVFLVLDGDAGPGGCGGIRRLSDDDAGIRYEVKHLYVREAGRGQGWGRMLLEALEEHARELGAASLVLDTHDSLAAAGALYARAGFVQVAPYNDNPNATRWYRKAL